MRFPDFARDALTAPVIEPAAIGLGEAARRRGDQLHPKLALEHTERPAHGRQPGPKRHGGRRQAALLDDCGKDSHAANAVQRSTSRAMLLHVMRSETAPTVRPPQVVKTIVSRTERILWRHEPCVVRRVPTSLLASRAPLE